MANFVKLSVINVKLVKENEKHFFSKNSTQT